MSKRIVAACFFLPLLGAAGPAERVVPVGSVLPIGVEGVAGRLRIDPGAPGLMLLAPDFAARARLKGGGLFGLGVGYNVGGQTVFGTTATAKLQIDGGRQAKRRVAFAPRPYAAGVEAVIGPAGMPEPIVRFVLRPPMAGERTVAIDLKDVGELFADWFPMTARIMVDGEPVTVRFAPFSRRTIANAELASRLAGHGGGKVSGPTTMETIEFGIERPIRTMTLARALDVGPLSIRSLGIRSASIGADPSLPAPTDAPPPNADPDEIVVTAKSKRKPAPARLSIGADYLARCSSIVFDKSARQLRLICA